MSADLTLFSYEGARLRTLTIDETPWFVAADACRMLDLSDTSSALKMVDDDDKQSLRRSDTPQFFEAVAPQVQMLTIVNESGMYALIFQSRKDQARKVRRWITGTVLPEIRKTGSYNPASARPAIDGNSITRMELIQIAMNAETERLALEAANQVLTPKAEAYDSFIDATGHYAIGAVAKMLGRSRPQLFRDLRNNGILIAKGSMRNTPYQQFMKHFVVKAHEFTHSNGDVGTSYTTYVQPGGIDFIRRRLGLAAIDPIPGGDA